jgi:hypothetical protein
MSHIASSMPPPCELSLNGSARIIAPGSARRPCGSRGAEASHWRSCRCAASSCVLPLVGIELPPAAIVECHGNIGPLRKKYRFTGGVHTASQLASQDSQFPPIRPNLHTEGTHCRQGNRGKSTASRLVGVHESGIQHPRLKVLSCALQRRWPTRTCGRGWRRRASTPT